ncbi:exonuclease RecJ [Geothermobacter ehrlichii]|uniref:Single-stranded-DNA-specific exonuclease RecJ n=1 Tax=Geothermobacter ehrlichii TaxID=213224 RepID=A0A5D3WKN8_9BACT|nr:single-stranded-DNA-specific exonuclease RecJ [Geothermobacter ehrlichii]TYO99564.1 exonuclease RecJ [Geothermobacter ehrlichii]
MKPVQLRRWRSRDETSSEAVGRLVSALGIHPLTARVLLGRAIDDEAAARAFFSPRLADLPDPFLLRGMPEAVERLTAALKRDEAIAVHGDYDVDGITATALLVAVLSRLGGRVDYHIPLRLKDGYGLSAAALKQAAGQGSRVVVSVDCGVSALQEAELAASLGLDLIITDHHQPPETLPGATALVNPHQPGCAFPDKYLSGVGVAFMLLVALRRRLRQQGWFASRPEPDLRDWLDLVALGTVADLVPLRGINRAFVRHGLWLMERQPRPGIGALKRVAGVREVTAGAVGFRLAPRLNAAGRLEDAATGVRLLLSEDARQAGELAERLDAWNRERQQIEQQTFDAAVQKLAGLPENYTIVLADDSWHQGVIGIVASRLVERYGRPTLLIALDGDLGKGSGRSIRGFHLYQGLQQCADHLSGFGGHEYAAGFSLSRSAVGELAAAFERTARQLLAADDLRPVLLHDGVVQLDEIDPELVDELERLAPFGMGNPEPVFVAEQVELHRIETVGDGRHLRCLVRQAGTSLPAIAFNMGPQAESLRGFHDILFTPAFNRWNGRVSLQLRLKDLRPASPAA